MRFVHTADWQLGMKASHVGQAAARVREERLQAARRVGEVAQAHDVDFVLIAGDTFQDNGVERVLIQKTADILASFSVPVYVIPGNHDPLVPGSVWEHPVWNSTGNITVLREEKPIEIAGGLLFPCPVREKHSRKDPTAWIHPDEAGGILIGMAHGTIEGIHQEEPDCPIPRDAVQRAGLDYLALGHWHSFVAYAADDGATRMAYSGTHETTRFGERDSGNVLVVDIPSAGATPVITPERTGSLKWYTIEEDLREPGDLVRLRTHVESLADPASTLIDLRLAGLLAAEGRDEIARLEGILASRFLFARLDVSQLRPSPEDESWLDSLPPGILRETASRLRELADPAFTGTRPEGASPEVASRALLELYALATGAQP